MDFYCSVASIAGIDIIMALSFYLPLVDQFDISLGQAGFMAVGAYASAVCTVKFGIPYIPSVLIGGIVAGIVGFVLGDHGPADQRDLSPFIDARVRGDRPRHLHQPELCRGSQGVPEHSRTSNITFYTRTERS